MTSSDASPDSSAPDLHFDRVVASSPSTAPAGVVCANCTRPITTEYYEVNGHTLCEGCRGTIEAAVQTPSGAGPLAKAALFGFGAAVAGAIVYYGVIALAHLEIGIIAVLCGYMVGYSVRKGAGGGGRRIQLLAIFLTYLSVGLAYAPLAIQQVLADDKPAGAGATADSQAAEPLASSRDAAGTPAVSRGSAGLLVALGAVALLVLALPIIVIIGSGASGLINVIILAVGMRQAWRMTAIPRIVIQGPFRVAVTPPNPA